MENSMGEEPFGLMDIELHLRQFKFGLVEYPGEISRRKLESVCLQPMRGTWVGGVD